MPRRGTLCLGASAGVARRPCAAPSACAAAAHEKPDRHGTSPACATPDAVASTPPASAIASSCYASPGLWMKTTSACSDQVPVAVSGPASPGASTPGGGATQQARPTAVVARRSVAPAESTCMRRAVRRQPQSTVPAPSLRENRKKPLRPCAATYCCQVLVVRPTVPASTGLEKSAVLARVHEISRAACGPGRDFLLKRVGSNAMHATSCPRARLHTR
jgi:hypothetical protein